MRYKLGMFGMPLEGPTDMLFDNEVVFKNTSTPESVLIKKYHSIEYPQCIEAVAALIFCIAKEDTEANLEDMFTNILSLIRREGILNMFTY